MDLVKGHERYFSKWEKLYTKFKKFHKAVKGVGLVRSKTVLKTLAIQILLMIVSFGIALLINKIVTANLLTRYIFLEGSPVMFLSVIALQSVVVYLIIRLITSRKLDRASSIMWWACYFLLLCFLLFGRNAGFRGVSLNPVSFIEEIVHSTVQFPLLIANMAMFIPIGYLFRKQRPIVSFCLFLSINIAIEGVQYLFSLGVFDLGDVTLNTMGFYIGYLFFRRSLSLKPVAVQKQ